MVRALKPVCQNKPKVGLKGRCARAGTSPRECQNKPKVGLKVKLCKN